MIVNREDDLRITLQLAERHIQGNPLRISDEKMQLRVITDDTYFQEEHSERPNIGGFADNLLSD